ncbi:signal peptidase I [Janthinobacterium fluminis]|uniref:Signal peptidase I n=1 Tax=Janthinobacterium fluminis TaxID=2987524 RepID=A0ABT5K080_9BURK|nr:signal peptidase I [Janthinobacterium fluminis]MDC8758373.1 signal peptidase I [Janthinobacterium fluminis]
MHTTHQARKPALAALMSLVLPGYGQLYNGEVNKAIWLFLTVAGFSQPVLVLAALYLPGAAMMPALLLALLLTLALWLYGIADAWRTARRLDNYTPQAWQLSGTYMLVLVLCDLIVLPLLVNYLRSHQVASYRVPSNSMAPGVLPGDYFFADKRYNCPACKQQVRRGDIALFVYPNDRTQIYIKRIIGLPGDHVQIQGTRVSVNGVALTTQAHETDGATATTEQSGGRQWQAHWNHGTAALPDADTTVAAGQVLVLGDNRNVSADSRHYGTVPLQDVVGKAHQVWFSSGAEGIRWSRLGKLLE